MNNSNPVKVAEFAVSRGFYRDPAFNWWVSYTIRRRDLVIAGVNSRVKRVTHKYGVELPYIVQEAYALDDNNGNTLWRDSLNSEMDNLKVAFDILPKVKSPPPG